MAEPIKRQRLELNVTDAKTSKSQSLFMETLGRGSGDTLPLIFKHISSLKDKMRLESVCKLFQKHGMSVEAWSNINCISIADDYECYRINNHRVRDRFFSAAVRSIFSRSRKVKQLHLACEMHRASTIVYPTTVDSILQQGGAFTFKNLQEMRLDAFFSSDSSEKIVQLIYMFRNQLTVLELCNMLFDDFSNTMTRPWIEIGECAHLTSFVIDGSRAVSCTEMTKRALCGKKIQMLDLGDCCTEADELVEIVSSLADQSLRILTFNGRFSSLSDFVSKLPASQWNSIKEIRYYIHKDPMWHVNQNWSAILRLPRINPHLQKLVLYARCKHSQAIELVLSYLKVLNESLSTRSFTIVHRLSLLGGGWMKVFDMLAKKHKCEIVPIGNSAFRIRCFQLGQSTVELFEQ